MKTFIKTILTFIVGLILLTLYDFLNRKIGFSIPCIFHEITGFYCPGCGITRMFFSLIHLEFYQAFRYNPLLFISLFIVIIYFIISLISNKRFSKKQLNKIGICYLIIVLVYAVLRNIELFSFLLPTQV